MHPLAGAGLVEKVAQPLFEYARANPPEHIILAGPLENDVLDAGIGQQLPSSRPDGPDPMITTCVRTMGSS